VGGSGEVPLPLSLEIVGTDRSLDDNEGAVGVRAVGGKEKTRAVASLETRMRVVASIEVLNPWGSMVLYMQVALRSVRSGLSRALPNWQ